MAVIKQPWKPSEATRQINAIACELNCDLAYTKHARDRMAERNLIVSDALFLLKNGFVYRDPEESSIDGLYKYCVEGQTPNSGPRFLRLVVVPDPAACQIKIITAMWRDET